MRASINLATMALVGALAVAAAPAHAVTFAVATGPYSLPGNSSGVIPSGSFAQGTNTYDFTFSTVGATYKTLMQMQASKLANAMPQNVSFVLFSGMPGSGTAVASSAGSPTAATLLLTLAPGDYYLELSTVAAPKELVTGGIKLFAVPEPATWSLMLLGVGALGAQLRRRRQAVVA